MAAILLIGPLTAVESFSRAIGDGHTLHRIITPADETSADSARALLAWNPIPVDELLLDAVFELGWDPAAEKGALLRVLAESLPVRTLLFTNAITMSATAAARATGPNLQVMGISWAGGIAEQGGVLEAAASLQLAEADAAAAIELLRAITGREVEIVEDRVGLVSTRILAMIVNEAAFALMEGVATVPDIDTAMKLGTNYPKGPLAWANEIGAEVIVNILESLYLEYHEERYRPCVLLRQYARAGKQFV